jgi:hypothetical protein
MKQPVIASLAFLLFVAVGSAQNSSPDAQRKTPPTSDHETSDRQSSSQTTPEL